MSSKKTTTERSSSRNEVEGIKEGMIVTARYKDSVMDYHIVKVKKITDKSVYVDYVVAGENFSNVCLSKEVYNFEPIGKTNEVIAKEYVSKSEIRKMIEKKSWLTEGHVRIIDKIGETTTRNKVRVIKESDWQKILEKRLGDKQ